MAALFADAILKLNRIAKLVTTKRGNKFKMAFGPHIDSLQTEKSF